MRNMEHKRAYDRERMARLWAEGSTWWQLRGRNDYDSMRNTFYTYFVRLNQRIAEYEDDETLVPQAKAEGRERVRRHWTAQKRKAELEREYGPCQYGPQETERKGFFTIRFRPCINPAHQGKHRGDNDGKVRDMP